MHTYVLDEADAIRDDAQPLVRVDIPFADL